MKRSLKLILAITTILIAIPLSSGVDVKRFLHLSVNEGLPMSGVTAITQDRKGFIWIGLEAIPLVKYDGRVFKIYDGERDLKGFLKGKGASCIVEDGNGHLWIGTQRGVVVFDPGLEKYKLINGDVIEDNVAVNTIVTDSYSRVWLGTERGLIIVRDQYLENSKSLKYVKLKHFLNRYNITSLKTGGNQKVWIGTDKGLFSYSFGTETPVRESVIPDIDRNSKVCSIELTEDNLLWVGTENRGLYSYNLNSGQTERICSEGKSEETRIGCNNITSLLESSRGELWIGTVNGLWVRDNKKLTRYVNNVDNPVSISGDRIQALFEDDSDMVWIGTKAGGINKVLFNSGMFGHMKHEKNNPDSLSSNLVYAVYEDSEGLIWFGSLQGVDVMEPETMKFRHFRHIPGKAGSLPHNHVYDINGFDDKHIWIGTRAGLSRMDKKSNRFRHFIFDPDNINNPANKINRIKKGMGDYLWLATYNGMLQFNTVTGRFRHYYHKPEDSNTLSAGYVWDIMEYEKDKLWICTRRGLNHYNRKTGELRHYFYQSTKPGGISGDNVYKVFRDRNGIFWFATTNGLNRYNRDSDTFTAWSVKDGLPDNTIYGIQQDNIGDIWVSTNRGLSKFNPVQMDFTNYDVTDGLQSMEFNFPSVKTSRGELIFAGINGVNFFRPESIIRDHSIPRIVFTDLRIFNSKVAIGESINGRVILKESLTNMDSITLSHKDYVFDIQFAALNFADPANNSYSYKLEGFEPEWNYVDNRNFATYTNLPHGEYILKVRASNSDDIWNNKGAELKIVVTPPFWQTAWFVVLVFVLVTGTAFSFYRFRINLIKRQNLLLEQLVEERSLQLEQSHKIIVEQAHKSGMAEVAANTLHNVGNILNSVFISIDNLKKLSRSSGVETLNKAAGMLEAEMKNIGDFVKNDPKGEKLMLLFLKVDKIISKHKNEADKLLIRIFDKVQEIANVITVQQAYSGKPENILDEIELEKIINDALVVCSDMIGLQNISIEKYYDRHQMVYANKPMLMQILMDIIANSVEALKETAEDNRKISFIIEKRTEITLLKIVDNGCGIPEEYIDQIFRQGFTTKSGKPGYRLHHCANSMIEMGGNICAESRGKGKGTTIILSFQGQSLKR